MVTNSDGDPDLGDAFFDILPLYKISALDVTLNQYRSI